LALAVLRSAQYPFAVSAAGHSRKAATALCSGRRLKADEEGLAEKKLLRVLELPQQLEDTLKSSVPTVFQA
jgi:hypothetical protein